MSSLKNKKIILGITGSIAAYKTPILLRLLVKKGAEVQVLMTEAAKDFVTPLTLSTLSGKAVLGKSFDQETGAWNSHVEMGLWADVMLFAPLSAATMAKMATGLTDNLLTTTYLSAKCPVFFAPAMDLDMFAHPATQANVEQLKSYGMQLIAPQSGELASGLCGAGRMEEPENIVKLLEEHFNKQQDFKDKKILISAGPTKEPIDPVRYISNYSSGKMGYALAETLAKRGAEVILVSGPVHISCSHPSVKLIKVRTADEMYTACHKHFPAMDYAIMAAAVADYKVAHQHTQKIKKTEDKDTLSIDLQSNPDILKSLSAKKSPKQHIIGFALETNNAIANAEKKLLAKGCDAIVLNTLEDKGAGFGYNTNKIYILSHQKDITAYPLKSKQETAKDICDYIAQYFM